MFQRVWRFCVWSGLLLGLLLLIGCTSGKQTASGHTPTTTSGPHKTATAKPAASGTATPGGPTPTATPISACNSQVADVPLPVDAVQMGKTTTKGASITCAYHVALGLTTTATFFKNQMGTAGWTLLKEQPQGALGIGQEYFKQQRFATITLTQHGSDPLTTDFYITIEASA